MPADTPEMSSTGGQSPQVTAYVDRPIRRWLRLFVFYSFALVLTSAVSMLFADLLWRSGWTSSSTILLILFVILFGLISIGCMHGVFGFVLRTFGDPDRITRLGDFRSQSIEGVSTAIIFPTYNEEVARVMEGLRATY